MGGDRGNITMLFGGWLLAWVTAVAPNISGKYLFLIFLTHLVIRIDKPFVFQLQNSKYGECQVMNNILKSVSPIHQSKKDNSKKRTSLKITEKKGFLTEALLCAIFILLYSSCARFERNMA